MSTEPAIALERADRPEGSQLDERIYARPRRPALAVVLAAGGILLLALNLRAAVTSVTPLLDRMRDDLGLNPAVIGLLGSLAPLAFAASGLVGTLLMRRMAAERVAVLAVVTMTAGEALRALSSGAAVFILLSAVTLLSLGVGNVILPALVKAWFPRRIGPVTAAYTTVMAVGTAIPALVAVPLADALDDAGGQGWRLGIGIWAAMAVVALPSWIAVARRPRTNPPPRRLEQDRRPGHDLAPHRVRPYRSPIGWGLGLVFTGTAMNMYALFTWMPIRLVDAGLSEAAAGAQLAVFAGVGLVPSLFVPALAARLRNTFGMAVACAVCFAVGLTGLLVAPATGTLAWTVIAGLGGGGFPLALTLIGLRSATPATAGSVSAFAQTVGYSAAVTAPLLFGLLHSATGGWTASFAFLAVPLVSMLVGGWLTATRRTVDDDLRARAASKKGWQVADTLVR